MSNLMTKSELPDSEEVHLHKPFLERAKFKMILGNFAYVIEIPQNSSMTVKARRYLSIPVVRKPLSEGVTPEGLNVTLEDIYFTLEQYGNWLGFSDMVELTHKDPVLQEFAGLLGEHAAELIERVRISRLMAGTNVFYANGASRSAVNTVVTKDLLRRVETALVVNRAQRHTRMVRSTTAYGTEAIPPCFVGFCHPYMANDIRDIDGFIPVHKYGNISPWDNEIGMVSGIRFLLEDLFEPFADAGGAVSAGLLSTSGTNCDVYPMLICGKDAFADVPLKGFPMKNADASGDMILPVKLLVLKSGVARDGDPIGQRGTMGYKLVNAGGILNDPFMIRVEAAASF
ncbi:N4-gp56 family major capsid protein [Solidesulfovibrio magneticus]|uniref:N4-gp56 family major capsid protein n=1 Tax=Solidesulfovibrio magneticus (strain ATCC 700980 / DSM 13731 / RS-1) TaxID=573370 RepID=C4XTJ9_SOLM1|nr:N4-gp56 family major capsid protein [Solidesulfovibrio magneticus]BAH75996.1 hypothetical protein DMR_25050 [Solidesulfovibrio magneticus RS-1]